MAEQREPHWPQHEGMGIGVPDPVADLVKATPEEEAHRAELIRLAGVQDPTWVANPRHPNAVPPATLDELLVKPPALRERLVIAIEEAEREVVAAKKRLDTAEYDLKVLRRTLLDSMVTGEEVLCRGWRFVRKATKAGNRSVNREALVALAAKLPEAAQPWEQATLDAELLPTDLLEKADVKMQYPTIALLEKLEHQLRRNGVRLDQVIETPGPGPDVLVAELVIEEEADA